MRRLLSLASPLLLTLAAGSLVTNWERLPERWPVHWGPGGEPNGWSSHTPASAGAPLVLGLFIWLVMEIFAARVERRSLDVPQADPAKSRELAEAIADMVRMCTVATCGLLAFVAAEIPLHPEWGQNRNLPLAMVGGMLGVIALACVIYFFRVRHLPMPKGYSALIYYNKSDPRLWVPKLMGTGWTLNFAHPGALPVMLLLLGIVGGLLALVAST